MVERFFQHTFANGLTLVAQKMPQVQSAAMTLLLSAGSASDPDDALGSATVISDLVFRGAGERDTRQLSDHLDRLGLHRSGSVGVYHTRFGAEAVAPKVIESIPVFADMIRRPRLPKDGFEAGRDLALQSLKGLEDDPRQKLVVKLRECFLPDPFGRNAMGRVKDLKKLTLKKCKSEWQRRYRARDSIVAIAGNIEFEAVRDEIERYFGDFAAGDKIPLLLTPPKKPYHFEKQESEQTHIGIAYPSVCETDEDYYLVRLAIEVLGGGMSSRLFTEVREKRGLCYAVWAGYSSIKDSGGILSYAGTSNERAQATFDCLLGEIHRLSDGVTASELNRAKIGLKASLILDGESTGARAGAIAYDWFMRGRMRTLDEIKDQIDRVSLKQVNDCLRRRRPGPFTVVIVGPSELKWEGR